MRTRIFTIVALAAFFFITVQYIAGFSFPVEPRADAFNVTGTPNPALSPANWYYSLSLAPLIAYIVRELLRYWKNRGWPRKYKDIIRTQPL